MPKQYRRLTAGPTARVDASSLLGLGLNEDLPPILSNDRIDGHKQRGSHVTSEFWSPGHLRKQLDFGGGFPVSGRIPPQSDQYPTA